MFVPRPSLFANIALNLKKIKIIPIISYIYIKKIKYSKCDFDKLKKTSIYLFLICAT